MDSERNFTAGAPVTRTEKSVHRRLLSAPPAQHHSLSSWDLTLEQCAQATRRTPRVAAELVYRHQRRRSTPPPAPPKIAAAVAAKEGREGRESHRCRLQKGGGREGNSREPRRFAAPPRKNLAHDTNCHGPISICARVRREPRGKMGKVQVYAGIFSKGGIVYMF